MQYFSMFSGIGGFELGIGKAIPDSQCVGYSEIDKYAIATYQSHFKHTNYGDATAIDSGRLPGIDLLVGGFPCQAFSVAGKRRGFDDTRGTLFFDVARILADKRPPHLVLENVKGLLSHDSGRTFQTILGVLTDMGYCVEWQVLNSKDFGVPQNRERVYIVGHLGDRCGRAVFPIRGTDSEDSAARAGAGEVSRTLRAHQGGVDIDDQLVQIGTINRGEFKTTKQALTVTASYHKGHDNHGQRPMLSISRQPLRYLNRNQKNIEGDYAYTVDASQTSGVKLDSRIRRLTPRECERLQGFPDDWTIGSDTQRYKQCGNAVTVNVVKAVIGGLAECLS